MFLFKYKTFTSTVVFIFSLITSFAQNSKVIPIYDKNSNEPFKFSDLFNYEGYTKLEFKGDSYIYSMSKILFYKDNIFVLSAAGQDQEKILAFKKSDGSFKGVIGRQGRGPGEYYGIRDIFVNKSTDELITYIATKLAFQIYDLDGRYKNYQRILMTATEFGILDNGYKVIYNEAEPGTYDVSDYHYVTILNNKGNIYNSFVSFPKELSDYPQIYKFTGSLSQSGSTVLFSPPFGEKIYSITKDKAIVLYEFDFGNYKIPIKMRNNPLVITNPAVTIDFSYLTTNFYRLKQFLFFGFKDKRRKACGFIDENTGKVFLSTNAINGPLKTIFTFLAPDNIVPVDDNTFAITINPEHFIDIRNNKDLLKEVKAVPKLYEALSNISIEDNACLLYFSIK